MTHEKKRRILIAADETVFVVLRSALSAYDLVEASTLQQADRWLLEDGIELFLIDAKFDDFCGMDLVSLSRSDAKHVKTPVMVFQRHGEAYSPVVKQAFEIMLKVPRGIDEYIEFENTSAVFKVKPLIERLLPPAEPLGRVLVVDDLDVTRQGTVLLLKSMGVSVDEASSGMEALARVEEQTYKLILMDCSMPVLDGFECTRKIRELKVNDAAKVPIIGFTASSEPNIKQLCLDAKMNDYLDKDCSIPEFKKNVGNWLQQPSNVQR